MECFANRKEQEQFCVAIRNVELTYECSPDSRTSVLPITCDGNSKNKMLKTKRRKVRRD